MPYRPTPHVLILVIWVAGSGCTTPLLRTDAGAGDAPSVDIGSADAGLGTADAGFDAGGTGLDVPTMDAGTSGIDADPCPPAFPPPPTGGVCSGATLMCLAAAMDATDQEACFAADPRADECRLCVSNDVLHSCAASGDCADPIGELQCCAEASCPSSKPDCIAASCGTETDRVRACVWNAQSEGRCGLSMLCFSP